jgi:lambda family phage tail tape measure protein
MASNQVNINLNLQDQSNSVKNRTDDVKNLNKELQKSQKLATGTKTGSKAAAASLSPGENIEYGRARGSMGATGASGRDFANQAQGLGGLVRLYATYAANVFAVSAAFSALSNAMDTSNMVKGLDQLGAASGVAMGALAKQFTEASGGAISLRESMEATAKAMSSGMTQKQFLQLGDVAKKASQALGVNMSDAVSRLTRGITKLEPELLDELGLFTKVGKSSEDYARSVGKSVDSLTDFEKRQAFANAVLKEGIDKFNEINIPTNPYDKLLASLKNIAQTILEVLNKAFVPLVDLLSASPAALTAGIAALGSMIVKQAIPSIVNYRAELRKTAEISKQVSDEKISTAETMLSKRRADILAKQDAAANAKAEVIDKLEAKLKVLSGGRIRKDIAEILTPTGGIQSITEKQIKQIEAAGKGLTKNKYIYDELADAIRKAKKAEDDYLVTAAKLRKEENEPVGRTSALGRLQIGAEEQRKRSASSSIISNAADTASLVGFRAAFGEMIDSLKTEKLGAVRSLFTGVTATVTAATTRLMGFIGTLGNIGMAIGVLVGTFQALNYVFGNNDKQVQKFNKTIELGDDNVRALTASHDKYKNSLSTASVIAMATSFQNLSENLKETAESFKQANQEANNFDIGVNGIKSIFGQSLEDDFAKSLGKQVSKGLNGILDPSMQKDTRERLKSILNINELTDDTIKQSLSSMSTAKLTAVGLKIADVFEYASKAGQKTSATLAGIKDGFTALDKSYTDLSNTLIQKDALAVFGKDLATQGFNFAEALKDPIANLATLRDLITDISKIKLLAPESQAIIMQNRDAYIALINTAKTYESQLTESQNKIEQLKAVQSRFNRQRSFEGLAMGDSPAVTKEREVSAEAKTKLDATRQEMLALAKSFEVAAQNSLKKGFELVEGSFTRKMAESVLASQKNLLDKLPQTAETAKLGARIENQKIDLQISQITETQRLIKEMELSRLQSEKQFIETRRDAALALLKDDASTRAKESAKSDVRISEIDSRMAIVSSTNISKSIKAGDIQRSPESMKAMQEQQGTMAQVAQLQDQKKSNILAAEVTGVQLTYDKTKKTVEDILKNVTATKEEEMKSQVFRNSSLADQQAIIEAYIEQEDSLKRGLNTLDSYKELAVTLVVEKKAEQEKWWEIYDIALRTEENTRRQLQTADNLFVTTTKTATAERTRENTLAVSLQTMDQIIQSLESQVNLTRIRNETENTLVDIQKEVLQNQLDLGVITADNYREQLLTINRIQTMKERDIKLQQLQNNLLATQLDLAKQALDPKNSGNIDSINAKREAATYAYLAEVEGINKVYEAKQKTKSLDDYLTDRQLKYGDILKNSFEGMADAVIEFTKTGKLNFKGMIDSFIEGLIRYEMQQQAIMMSQAFKPGFMNFIGSIFGNMGNTGSMTGTMAGPVASAKGSVYDTGLKTFAKGGMFTNSVVNEPTLFKFAKGTGLMGEAGPEAIMPLKRDSNGNLGVRAAGGGGNVDVVVNNYSTAQAETKETVDSRGNRKIEVVIGDMTAGEISRNGSASQKAIRGTFGLQPQLIRR